MTNTGQCEMNYDGCTGRVRWREDPYEADVNNNPGQSILICDHCYRELCDDI
jgi:hypothetical protein